MRNLILANAEQELEAYQKSLWYSLSGAGSLGWCNLGYTIMHKALEGALGVPGTNKALSDEQIIVAARIISARAPTTRIKPVAKGYSVFLPIYADTMPIVLFSKQGVNVLYSDTANTYKQLEKLLPNIWDASQPVDARISVDVALDGVTSADLGFEEEDTISLLKSGIKSLRFISAPVATQLPNRISSSLIDAWATDQGDMPPADLRTYMAGCLALRSFTIMAEIFFPKEAAAHVCYGEPKLSLLSTYFIHNLQSTLLFGSREWLDVVGSLRVVDADVRESKIEPISRVDKAGLAVTQGDELLWVPTVNNIEEVEAEIEEGGFLPNGEWSRMDAINPQETEYIQIQRPTGGTSRVRKPKGRNRLIYTDWVNSLLTYTDDAGAVHLMDLSMYRPARPGQLRKLLEAGADKNLHSIELCLSEGVYLGASVENAPGSYAPYFSQSEANTLTAMLNQGKFAEFLHTIAVQFEQVRRRGVGGDGEVLTAEQLAQFDELYQDGEWMQLDNFHPDHPFGGLAQAGTMIRKSLKLLQDNPERVFGRKSVPAVLTAVAHAVVISEYAGKLSEVRSLDIEERSVYTNPDLAPINELEITDIPFVSGGVELFPHQVRAWNYLKNLPKKAVLDVAAGGGKTLLILLSIAYNMGKGLRKPLIACPSNLIKNYINDATWLFKGRVNMVVLNKVSMDSPEWGEEKLLDLVLNAPVNTIFLTDFNFLIPRRGSSRMHTVQYGPVAIDISLNVEFLKKVKWGGLWIDESHLVKNPYGGANKELARLAANIEYLTEATGTYISDNLTDAVGQFGLINPSTFGDTKDFQDTYYTNGKGSTPVPGAQALIRAKMGEEATIVQIRRKEWAAILPKRSDAFYPVEMSAAQRSVYEAILTQEREALTTRLREDRRFRALMEQANNPALEDDEQEDAQRAVEDFMENELQFYLARLEQFVSAPERDPIVIDRHLLSGADLISPKVEKVAELIRKHIKDKVPGKIIVWTSYVGSAKSIYDNLPADLRKHGLHYVAASGESTLAEFASNPDAWFLVGCEHSMNTGLNLQFCSHIIRLNSPWNWGTLEQGEARVNRPVLNDPRKEENGGKGIFYSWVFCDGSVDVVKTSRMISKLISTVKFYESTNPLYQQLPELAPIRLNASNIFSINRWDSPGADGCIDYFQAYQAYAQLEEAEFAEFAADPNNRIEPYTLEEGEMLKGSGFLDAVPYIPQMQLYGQSQLGLIPFIDYANSETNKKGELLAHDPEWDVSGLKVHTEFGDCLVRGFTSMKQLPDRYVMPKRLRVITPDGTTATVPTTAVWVITKETASGRDIRQALAKQAGFSTKKVVPVGQVKQVPVKEDKTKAPKTRAPEPNDALGFDVFLETFGGYASLVLNTADASAAAALPVLTKLGFKETPVYWYSKVNTHRTLDRWIDSVIDAGLSIDAKALDQLENDLDLWKAGKDLSSFAKGLSKTDRQRFLFQQRSRVKPGTIMPYVVAQGVPEDEQIFLCLNDKPHGATAINDVRSVRVPGIKWAKVEGEHWCFVASKPELAALMKELFARFTITNKKELIAAYKDIRIKAPKRA